MGFPQNQRDELPKLGICLIQAYRAPSYIRGASLKAALLATTLPDSLYLAMNRSSGLRRYGEAIMALLQVRRQFNPPIYLLAFRGHELAWLVRRLTRSHFLVFDAMMSPYAALAEDRKYGTAGRVFAKLWKPFERAALAASDLVLTDTHLHATYLRAQFDIPTDKIIVVPVGAVEPDPKIDHDSVHRNAFVILFYGSFLPLHGIQVILDAVDLLQDLPLQFEFVGGSQTDARLLSKRLGQGGSVRYRHREWVPFEELLASDIPNADLCLGGPFGNTPQSRRVVTGKTYQFLASGKATIVGKIDEDCGFIHHQNCLLVEQADPTSLADEIRWAYRNKDKLTTIGASARELYRTRYSPEIIGRNLVSALAHAAYAKGRRASK